MGKKTKIDWADATWNPVTGCLHDCEYCYARRFAERFGATGNDGKALYTLDEPLRTSATYEYLRELGINEGKIQPYPFGFAPTFHRYRLDEPQHWKKPKTIFVCSMADLFGAWVPEEWIMEVFAACKKAMRHKYLFLTKNPARYLELGKRDMLPDYDNFWFGTTVEKPTQEFFYETPFFTNKRRSHSYGIFLSIEPVMSDFPVRKSFVQAVEDDASEDRQNAVDWFIVGAETGNRKSKVIPKREWIDHIAETGQNCGIPVFMKESLRSIMGDNFKQEFPWEVTRR